MTGRVPTAVVTPRQIIAEHTYDRFKGLCPDCEAKARENDKGLRPNLGYNQYSPNFMFGGQEFTAIEGEIIRLLIAAHATKTKMTTKVLSELVYGPTLYSTEHSLRQRIYILRTDKRLWDAGYEIIGHGLSGYRLVDRGTTLALTLPGTDKE